MRARNIKPGFFKNDCLGSLSIYARYLFAGLWCLADREGRLEDRPQKIKAEVFPYDAVDIEKLLVELAKNNGDHPFILRYQVEGKRYIQVVNFTKHQNPHRNERASIIPPPPEEALQEMKETLEERPVPGEEKELQKTYLGRTKDIPNTDLGYTQDIPWSYQGRTLARINRADSPDSLILRFSDSPDSLIADSLKEASPNGEAQRPLRAPPPPEGQKRTQETAPRKEEALSKVPPPREETLLSGPLLQAEKAPLGGAPPQPEDSPLSVLPLQPKEVSLGVPPLQDAALGAPSTERGSYPQLAGSQQAGSPAQPVKAPPLVKMKRSLRSPPHPEKAQRSLRSPPHPAVEAYKKAFFYYPRRNLYSLIAEKVGDDEEDLRLWAKACQSWAAHGWNPRNIAGLLEYYEKRGFLEKNTISRGIPKFSRAAQIAIELAEKYEREEGNEEREKEDIFPEEGDQGISAFFKAGAPSPFSHPP